MPLYSLWFLTPWASHHIPPISAVSMRPFPYLSTLPSLHKRVLAKYSLPMCVLSVTYYSHLLMVFPPYIGTHMVFFPYMCVHILMVFSPYMCVHNHMVFSPYMCVYTIGSFLHIHAHCTIFSSPACAHMSSHVYVHVSILQTDSPIQLEPSLASSTLVKSSRTLNPNWGIFWGT